MNKSKQNTISDLISDKLTDNNSNDNNTSNADNDSNDSNDKFMLTLESQGQMSEYEILYKSCIIMKEKLKITKELLKEQYSDAKIKDITKLKIELKNEDHTLGNIINEYLQDHKGVLFAGVSKPSLLIDTMVITMQTLKKDPLGPLLETIDYVIKIFDNIQTQIKKLSS